MYTSMAGLKKCLGLSRSKVLRLEAKGIIPRPRAIPRGSVGSRWYRGTDIEAIAAILDGSAVDSSVGEEGEPVRSFQHYSRPGRRRAREQVDVNEDDEWSSPAEAWAEGRILADLPRRIEVDRCPLCNGELVWETVQGAQIPSCSRRGVVDLGAAPQPKEGTCKLCGGEVLWQVDAVVPGGFATVCDRCGVTEVHPRKVVEHEREKQWAAFSTPADDGHTRHSRGLGPRDAVYAVRKRPPSTRPKLEIMLPHERSGGPR